MRITFKTVNERKGLFERPGEEYRRICAVLFDKGEKCLEAERFDYAMECFELASEISKEYLERTNSPEARRELAKSIEHIACTNSRRDRTEDALNGYMEALDIRKALSELSFSFDDTYGQAEIYAGLGRLYWFAGEAEKAKEYYLIGCELCGSVAERGCDEENRAIYRTAEYRHRIADICASQHDDDGGLKYCIEAAEIMKSFIAFTDNMSYISECAEICYDILKISLKKGDDITAEKYGRSAADCYERFLEKNNYNDEYRDKLLKCLYKLADIAGKNNDALLNAQYTERALINGSSTANEGHYIKRAEDYYRIGLVYRDAGDHKKARQCLTQALAEAELAAAKNSAYMSTELFTEICTSLEGYLKTGAKPDGGCFLMSAELERSLIRDITDMESLEQAVKRFNRLGEHLKYKNNDEEAFAVYKNAVFAGRKLKDLHPYLDFNELLAPACFGCAKTAEDKKEKIKYAKLAFEFYDDLKRSSYYNWEKYERDAYEAEMFLKSLTSQD